LSQIDLKLPFFVNQAAENKNDVTRRLQGEREVDGVNGAVIWPGRNSMGMMIVDEQQNHMMRLLQMQQRLTVHNLALRSEPAINSRSLPGHSVSEYGQVRFFSLQNDFRCFKCFMNTNMRENVGCLGDLLKCMGVSTHYKRDSQQSSEWKCKFAGGSLASDDIFSYFAFWAK
jgi:hypothetical protein